MNPKKLRNLKSVRVVSLLACLSLVIGSACVKKSEEDALAAAQQCLDSATVATVDECTAKVESISGQQADGIRCFAAFIKEGFGSASKLVNSLNSINGGINSTNYDTFLGLISFTSQGTTGLPAATANYNLSKTASAYCSASKVKSGTLISTFAFLANAFYKAGCDPGSAFTCSPTCNTGNSSACITNGAATIALNVGGAQNGLLTDLGGVVVNTYVTSCDSGTKTDEMCTLINKSVSDAGGVANTLAVGQNFVQNIQN